MRDAIVFSGMSWEAFNVPERISLALAQLGCTVLHCGAPLSVLRHTPRPVREVSPGIHSLHLSFVSSRLNMFPSMPNLQAGMMRRQIQGLARELCLRDPIFFYSPLGEQFPLCQQMKRDHFLVHLAMDHIRCDPHYERHVDLSDQTLVIPRSSYHASRAKFGEKVKLIPQSVDFTRLNVAIKSNERESSQLTGIPKPRLGYLGSVQSRLNLPLLSSVLEAHPDWHFISMGSQRAVPLSNAHGLPWVPADELSVLIRSLDVAFLPYNCSDDYQLHCVPLKVFDSFALGIPVVSTPLINLWEYKDLIYFGDTAQELASAIENALREPPDSPKRAARIEIAKIHSLENLATLLANSLPLTAGCTSLLADDREKILQRQIQSASVLEGRMPSTR
jgi:glycosyltransferase involved in cell wall biosynthesis